MSRGAYAMIGVTCITAAIGCETAWRTTPGQNNSSQVGESATIEVTDDTFEALVIDSPLPVLVDYWAAWCGPCHELAPIVEQLAVAVEGDAVIAKLNVDDNPVVTTQYQITALPTMLIYDDGVVVDRITGVVSQEYLKDRLAQWTNVEPASPVEPVSPVEPAAPRNDDSQQ